MLFTLSLIIFTFVMKFFYFIFIFIFFHLHKKPTILRNKVTFLMRFQMRNFLLFFLFTKLLKITILLLCEFYLILWSGHIATYVTVFYFGVKETLWYGLINEKSV